MSMRITTQGLLWLAVLGGPAAGWSAPPAAQPPPARVLIIGDSMMKLPAHALELALAGRAGVTTRAYTSIGSGLARLDSFDWMEKTRTLLAEFNPDMTLVWFGTNDRQPMQTADRIIKVEDAEWPEEYARRVGALMDLITTPPAARMLWLELPDMRDDKIQKDVLLINRLVQTEAGKRSRVEFFLTRPILGHRPGKFTPYVIGPKGMPIQLRDPDGMHLNRAGADRLAEHLVQAIYGTNTGSKTIESQ